jgi:mannosyltransferase OCH1-like enzyme
MIPKFIHQTIRSKKNIHPELEFNIEILQKKNPDWQYFLYDDEDCLRFIEENYGSDYLENYLSIDFRYGAARADYFRYLLLYKRGGVYLDIKSTVIFPLSLVIGSDWSFVISQWDNRPQGREPGAGNHSRFGVDSEFQQWFIICEPGHPFLKSVIDSVTLNISNYDPLKLGVGASGVYRTTGPIAFTKAIRPILNNHMHIKIDIYTIGFRYSSLRGDRHRQIIQSYREIRFPIVSFNAKRLRNYNKKALLALSYLISHTIALLHEFTKVLGFRDAVIGIKKARRARKSHVGS